MNKKDLLAVFGKLDAERSSEERLTALVENWPLT